MAIDANNAPSQDLQGEKSCTKCGEVKPLSEFYKKSASRDGHHPNCKACCRLVAKAYFEKSPEKVQQSRKAWKIKNPEKVKLEFKRYYDKNKDEQVARVIKYHNDNVEKRKAYRAGRIDHFNAKRRENRLLFPEKHRERDKSRNQSPTQKCINFMRKTQGRAAVGDSWSKRTEELLGYSRHELRLHLERQFTGGMNWENYGKWHIDHIIPLSSFGIERVNSDEFKLASALSNIQPLWSKDNLSKGSRILTLL